MVAEWKPLIKAIKYNDPVIFPIIIMDLKTIWETILKQTSLARSIQNGAVNSRLPSRRQLQAWCTANYLVKHNGRDRCTPDDLNADFTDASPTSAIKTQLAIRHQQ